MRDERKTEIRVGIISIAALILFLWVLIWAKDITFGSTDREILIRFPEVAGLEVGDYVTVNGVRSGNVKDILVQEKSVLVRISLSNDVRLNKDAEIAVMMLDLMGGKKIEIKPGSSPDIMNYTKVQRGHFYADIPSVMSLLGSVQDDLLASIKDIRITLSSLNEFLTDKNLKTDVKNSLKNLNSLLAKIDVLADKNQQGITELVKNTKELTGNANKFLSENSGNLTETITNLKTLLVKTDSLVNTVNKIASETAQGKNNLGRIMYDDEMFNKLQTTLEQLNELTKTINDQLKSNGLKVDADVDLF